MWNSKKKKAQKTEGKKAWNAESAKEIKRVQKKKERKKVWNTERTKRKMLNVWTERSQKNLVS